MDIYRGQAGSGMGNSPSATIEGGDQYLKADPELWTEDIAKSARPWMTLDADELDRGQLGEKLEGWSYFTLPYGNRDLCFVVRLRAFGAYLGRNAYFAHGRAWYAEQFAGGNDWGALLGCPEAFSKPWRDCQPPPYNAAIKPEMRWQQLIRDHLELAITLVAALSQAVQTQIPAVMLAPLQAFLPGSSLPDLVSFARAALPIEEKIGCRVRIYTSRPDVFLEDLRADLVVIPERLRDRTLQTNRKCNLIGTNGEIISGKLSSEASLYAQTVVSRARDLPAAFFLFTDQVGKRVKSGDPRAAAYYVYNLIAAGDNTGAAIRSIYAKARDRNDVFPWERLISDQDWRACDTPVLRAVALQYPENDDARRFRQCALDALRRVKQEKDLPGLKPYLRTLSGERLAQEILYFHSEGLLSKSDAAGPFSDLPIDVIWRLMASDENAKLIAGVFDSGAEIPAKWLKELPAMPDGPEEVATRLLRLLSFCSDQLHSPWRSMLDSAVDQLAKNGPVPRGPLLQYCDLPLAGVEDLLWRAEMLYRIKEQSAANKILGFLGMVKSREERRQALEYLKRCPSLQSIEIPSSWDEDVADLILKRDRNYLVSMAFPRLIQLAKKTVVPTKLVYDIIDSQVRNDLSRSGRSGQALGLLQENGFWLAWRVNSGLDKSEFRDCALAWLVAPKSNVRLEEWKQIMIDLQHRLSGSEIDGLDLKWLVIPLFEQEQYAELARACRGDLGALAALAERINRAQPPYSFVLEAAGFPGDMSNSLHALNPQFSGTAAPLSLEEAKKLVNSTTYRKERALQAAEVSIFRSLRTESDIRIAIEWARELNLWSNLKGERFLSMIQRMLVHDKFSPSPALLDALNSALSSLRAPTTTREDVARLYLDDYRLIAEFLHPGISRFARPLPEPRQFSGSREELLREIARKGRERTYVHNDARRLILEVIEPNLAEGTVGEIGAVGALVALSDPWADKSAYWAGFVGVLNDVCHKRRESFEHALPRVWFVIRDYPQIASAFHEAIFSFESSIGAAVASAGRG